MRTFCGSLIRDRCGTSAIELGLIGPILAAVVCCTVEASLGFAQKLRDQQAADRGAQFAYTSGLSNATASQIQSEAATAAGLPTSAVTVAMWLECNGVAQADFNGICTSGIPARYVSVRVSDRYTPIFGTIFSAGSIPLTGFAAVRVQ